MIARFQIPGANLILIYELTLIQNTTLILFKTSLAPEQPVLRECWNYFVREHNINANDIVAQIARSDDDSSDDFHILRNVQNSIVTSRIDEREGTFFAANREYIHNLMNVVLAEPLTG